MMTRAELNAAISSYQMAPLDVCVNSGAMDMIVPDKVGGGAGKRGPALKTLSKKELYSKAVAAGVKGRSKMTKEELVAALQKRSSRVSRK